MPGVSNKHLTVSEHTVDDGSKTDYKPKFDDGLMNPLYLKN